MSWQNIQQSMLLPQTVSINGFQACHLPFHQALILALWCPCTLPKNDSPQGRCHSCRYAVHTLSRYSSLHQSTMQRGVLCVTNNAITRLPRSDKLPPQMVLVWVLKELEDDSLSFCCAEPSTHSIYTKLVDQYKFMDTASNIVRWNVLVQHLCEVINVLEQRVRRSHHFNLKCHLITFTAGWSNHVFMTFFLLRTSLWHS